MTTRIHYHTLLAAVEAFATQALRLQVLDPSTSAYGGFRCPEHAVCEPLAAANTFSSLATLYLLPESQHYHNPALLERLHLAMQFILRTQHSDGSIHAYLSGDVHIARTIALALHALLRAYRWLDRENQHDELLRQIRTFTRKGVDAIKNKPVLNSRDCWIAAAALVEYDRQFNDSTAVTKAESYLHDGININSDGIYDDTGPAGGMLSNEMLLVLAERLGHTILLDHVRRSLSFFLHTFHANGETATEFSDHDETGMPTGYSVWKKMSIIDHNGYYAAAGDLTLSTYLQRIDNGLIRPNLNHPKRNFRRAGQSRFLLTSDIGDLLAIEAERTNDWITRLPIPSQYEKIYRASSVARIRAGKVSATIIGGRSTLFSLQNGNAIIDGFRIRYLYHGFRDFVPTGLEAGRDVYLARNEIIQYIYKPTLKRREVIPLNLRIFVEIEPISDGFQLCVSTAGEADIPLQIEFGLRKQGRLYIGNATYDLGTTDLIFLDKEPARIVNGADEIEIDGGTVQHKIHSFDNDWTTNLETARLLITPITPCECIIKITCR